MRGKLGKGEIHEVAGTMKNILWYVNRKEKTGYGGGITQHLQIRVVAEGSVLWCFSSGWPGS